MGGARSWTWSEGGVVVERTVEGSEERIWVNPSLPSDGQRAPFRTRVEILCWFDDVEAMNAGLQIMRAYFWVDTVLAAIRRRDDATRCILYSRAGECAVHERYFAIRARLRPTAIGLSVALEPGWESLAEILPQDSWGKAYRRRCS